MVFWELCNSATVEFSVLSEAMLVKPLTARAEVFPKASSAHRTLLSVCRVQKYWQYWFTNIGTTNTGSPISGVMASAQAEGDGKTYSKLSCG